MKIDNYIKTSPIFAIYKSNQIIFSKISDLLESEGVNFIQALSLITIYFEDGNISPTELVGTFMTSKSSISQILNSLQKKKWIKRTLSTTDARSIVLELTSLGKIKACEFIRIMTTIEIDLEKDLGKKRTEQLVSDLHQIVEFTRN